ncbi:MAG TPA: hypothetical protein VMN60_09735 [Longimicrobiales bacterium]|nr:hypothetical protein [Longimicrobiales bacterium]
MRTTRPLLALLLSLSAAAPAVAQGGMNLQIVPKIGVYTPMGGLTETTEIKPGLAYGVAAEITLPFLPVNIRANADVAHSADIEQRSAAEPSVGSVTLTSIVGDLVLRPLPRTALAQPYFLAGVGIKQYDMDLESRAGGELSGLAEDITRFTAHIGGGLDVRFGVLAFVLEVGDYISSFRDATGTARVQNDVVGLIGFRVSMF